MTENVADRYRRRAADFAATVAAVPPGRWNSPSPCEGWSATDLLTHVIDTQGMFLRLIGRDLAPGPAVSDEPLAAFLQASGQTQRNLDDPATAALEFDGYLGRTTYSAAVDRFLSFDLAVHRWDLGTAAGLDVQLDPSDIHDLQLAVADFGETLQTSGACGPPLDVAHDADDQTRLLASLGRRA